MCEQPNPARRKLCPLAIPAIRRRLGVARECGSMPRSAAARTYGVGVTK